MVTREKYISTQVEKKSIDHLNAHIEMDCKEMKVEYDWNKNKHKEIMQQQHEAMRI